MSANRNLLLTNFGGSMDWSEPLDDAGRGDTTNILTVVELTSALELFFWEEVVA